MALNFSRCNRPLTCWVCLLTSSGGDNCNAWYVMRYHVVASSQVSAFLPPHLRRPSAACDQSSQRYNVCTRPTHLPGRIHPHYCPVGGIAHICNSSGHLLFYYGCENTIFNCNSEGGCDKQLQQSWRVESNVKYTARNNGHGDCVGSIAKICTSEGTLNCGYSSHRIQYLIAIRRGDATNNYNNHGV